MSVNDDVNVSSDLAALDGNAAAGPLQQIFGRDITTAQIMCASCESVRPLAALRLYGLPMGSVLYCPQCQAVLIRAVVREHTCWIDFHGVSRLRLTLE